MADSTSRNVRRDTDTARRVPDGVIAATLAFVASWTDTVGFVALFGLFTAHVTGNFVIIGSAIVHATGDSADHLGLAMKLAALPLFAIGAAAAAVLVRWHRRTGRSALRSTLIVEAALLAVALASGLVVTGIGDADAVSNLVASSAAVLAMGVQNACGRLLLPQIAPTTVMTVNVAQFAIDVVALIGDRAGETPEGSAARGRARRLGPAILSFLLGSIAAALAYRAVGFVCLAVPVLLLVTLASLVPSHSA